MILASGAIFRISSMKNKTIVEDNLDQLIMSEVTRCYYTAVPEYL